jgi:hypothetical protein
MAIFAKKKHARKEQSATGSDGTHDSVALEFPGPGHASGDAHAGSAGDPNKASKPAKASKGTSADAASNDTGRTDATSSDTAGKAATGATAAANDTAGAAGAQAQTDLGSTPEASVGVGVAAPGVAATGAAAGTTGEPEGAGKTMTDGVAAPDADPVEPVEFEPEEVAPAPTFGIEDAIRLMRSLPADPNIDLVVRVVRVTLSAVNVSVEEIMQDATRKEKKVRESISMLETEVSSLEEQLQARRAAIAAHQADLRETATVRERLHMADKYTPHPPPPPPGATRVPLPKPREWERFDSDTPFKDS